ncbi:MAG: endolytic transglycosylase MltG [Gammaproteobacteria bacterium]|nr:endolytic transglycosylase MltG [Gammaproteobacteria bacterium]
MKEKKGQGAGEEEGGAQRFRLWLVLAAASLLTAALLAVILADRRLNRALPGLAESRVFTIEAGITFRQLSRELGERGIVDSPFLFNALGRFRGVEQSIRQGEYELPADASAADLLTLFVAGTTRQRRLTLIEGWTFAEALAEIQRGADIEPVLAGKSMSEIAGAMELETPSPEGMIFPDTYFYSAGDTDLDLLTRASSRLEEVLDEEWLLRHSGLPLATPYEALILASIVEKEAAAGGERGLVAGVFLRRLARNMRLQSDPTVIYGLGARFDGDLRVADLREDTAHNTYRIDGLPPTPIALASRESIRASLRAATSEYLYFVADDQGGHYFSETLAEHNLAVDCFQRKRENAACEQLSQPAWNGGRKAAERE